MRHFRDISIRSKLVVIIFATSCATLLFGGGALIARYAATEENNSIERLTILAKVISANIAAAVSFHEPVSARETLAGLSAEPNILAAYVYDNQGKLFARFVAPGASGRIRPINAEKFGTNAGDNWNKSGFLFSDDSLLVSGPIVLDGERIGTILFDADLRHLRVALLVDVGLLALIILAAGLMALFLFSALQKIVSKPITHLARTMRHVSRVKDYGVRVSKLGNDEIGTLFDGFNEMLEQISARDAQLESRRAQLEDAQRIAHMGYWEWDIANNRMSLSHEALNVLGVREEQFGGTLAAFLMCVHTKDVERVNKAFQAAKDESAPLNIEHRIAAPGGQLRFLHLRGEIGGDESRQRRCLAGSMQDVTERVLAEEQLRIAANALESTGDSILITDRFMKIVSVNRAFTTMTHYSRDEVLGRTPNFLLSEKHDASFYDSIQRQVATARQWHGEIWGRRRNGDVYPQRVSISQVKDSRSKVSHYVFVSNDISQYKRYEENLKFLAHHDVLTELPNRALFQAELDEAISRAQRHGDLVGLIFIDLDHFKAINDTLGHAVGDQLLQSASLRIKDCLRECDIVARQGGDEFSVLLDAPKNAQDAAKVAQKIIGELAEPFYLAGQDLFITASIGIAFYPDDGRDADSLMKNADAAMYSAKEHGRNSYQFYRATTTQP